MEKIMGLDEVLKKNWKCLGDMGVGWLTNNFNKILSDNKIPNEWRNNNNTYTQEQMKYSKLYKLLWYFFLSYETWRYSEITNLVLC